jgi:hypothetical protein
VAQFQFEDTQHALVHREFALQTLLQLALGEFQLTRAYQGGAGSQQGAADQGYGPAGIRGQYRHTHSGESIVPPLCQRHRQDHGLVKNACKFKI